MSTADKYLHGSWNVTCARCGFNYKAAQLQEEWTGHMVCKGSGTNDCWEERHPQELVRISPDNGSVEYTRVEPRDTYIDVDYIATTIGVQE